MAPVLLASGRYEADLLRRALTAGVLAYLVQPIRGADLEAASAAALARFGQLRAARAEAERLRRELADHKAIERAKGLLMRAHKVGPEAASHCLEQLAGQRGRGLAEAAQAVLEAHDHGAIQSLFGSGALRVR